MRNSVFGWRFWVLVFFLIVSVISNVSWVFYIVAWMAGKEVLVYSGLIRRRPYNPLISFVGTVMLITALFEPSVPAILSGMMILTHFINQLPEESTQRTLG